MANVLILGGGFGGVAAAEPLAAALSDDHQITLVSRDDQFLFYPALVRLAFGKCDIEDVSYDLREAMLDRRIRFVRGEVARIEPDEKRVRIAHGDFEGDINYDYLICALGRRLATERIPGFFEHAHHLLTAEAAMKFGEAARAFKEGHAVIGYCEGARLAVPVYETVFALARQLEESGQRRRTRITLISPEPPGSDLGGEEMARALHEALREHGVEFLPDFPVNHVSADDVRTAGGRRLDYDLLMLVPPFQGTSAARDIGITDDEGYIQVDPTMRVPGFQCLYAVGDCASFPGPKMGHIAVQQGEVAAVNIAAEIEGRSPEAHYNHEMMLVIDEGGADSIYLHRALWKDEPASVRQGRFWSWAKRVHERYWQYQHK